MDSAAAPPPVPSSASARKAARRPLLIAGGALLLLLTVAMGVASHLLLDSYREVEAATIRQRAEQVQHALDTDLRQLELSNRDYAEWDDAEQWSRTGDQSFIDSNFSKDSLDGMHVDVVLIVDATGALRYSAQLERSPPKLRLPAPGPVIQALLPYARGLAREPPLQPVERIVTTPAGLMGFSTREIKRSDKSAASGYWMLFARQLGHAEVLRVRQTSHLPADLLFTSAAGGAAGPVPPADIAGWARSAGPSELTRARLGSDTQINGYALLRSVTGQPVAVLGTSMPRSIYSLGFRTTRLLLATLAGLMALASAIVFHVLWRLQRSHAARVAAASRYRSITAQLSEIIIVASPVDGRITDANQAALNVLGCDRAGARLMNLGNVFPDLDATVLANTMRQSRERLLRTSRLAGDDGSRKRMEVSITRMDSEQGGLLCLVGHDISHRIQAEEQQRANQRRLIHLAQHDSLTGLPNRLFLRARLPRALKLSAATNRSLAVIYLDVDHFKSINDSRGHGFGDQLLQVVASRLRNAVAAEDVVVRMGGDEFVIVVPLASSREAVEALARRLRVTISAPLSIDGAQVSVTSSMGIALHPEDALDTEGLLKHADIALYQAKEAGRNTHRFFIANMDVKVSEEMALEQALRHALGSDQFYVEYQPVVELTSSRISSLEALMRWKHPDLGLVPPSRFIAAAEKIGVIDEVGEQVLRIVLQQLQQWQQAGVPCVPVAVNVSPKQLVGGGFALELKALCEEFGVSPHWLRCEITESVLMQGTERIINTLRELRAMGTQVLIDDFGTGYSSLGYLERMPFDTLKIDRSFIAPLGGDQRESTVINAIIQLAQKLKLNTVAEGVETMEQMMMLRELGCTHVQGYFYSKPLGARRCRHLLECAANGQSRDDTVMVRVSGGG